MTLILALGRQSRADPCELKTSLIYISEFQDNQCSVERPCFKKIENKTSKTKEEERGRRKSVTPPKHLIFPKRLKEKVLSYLKGVRSSLPPRILKTLTQGHPEVRVPLCLSSLGLAAKVKDTLPP